MRRDFALAVAALVSISCAAAKGTESGVDYAQTARHLHELYAAMARHPGGGKEQSVIKTMIYALCVKKSAIADGELKSEKLDFERARENLRMFRESKAYRFVSPEEDKELRKVAEWMDNNAGSAAPVPTGVPESMARKFANSDGLAGVEFHAWAFDIPKGLAPGDLVVRRQDGYLDHAFRDASAHEKRFTHAGILVEQDGGLVVASMFGDELTMHGELRLQSWMEYCAASVEVAVYRYSGKDAANVCRGIAVAAKRRRGVPLDFAFDLKTKDRLYCTELVRDCVNEAAGREVVGTTKAGDFEYVAVDDCYRKEMVKLWDSLDERTASTEETMEVALRYLETRLTDEVTMPVVETASTTNAPVRRTIRFIPKNQPRR